MRHSKEEMNTAAMKIILHAGDCRTMLNEAIRLLEEDASTEVVEEKLKEAKVEITKAHKIQTEMIQNTIEEDNLETTLLFTHAQDTLMTIYSELTMTHSLIRLYHKLNQKLNA